MPKQPSQPLGTLVSPFGEIKVRIERHQYSGRLGFRCSASTAALRWLTPNRKIGDNCTRTFLLPPPSCTDEAALRSAFMKLQAVTARRFAEVPAATITPSSMTLGSAIETMRIEAKASLRSSSFETYEHEWKGLLKYIPVETKLQDLTRDQIQLVVARKVEDGLAPPTIRKHLVQLNRIMKRAKDDGVLDRNPCDGVRVPRGVKPKPRFLTDGERQRLLAAAKAKGRDAYLMVACGIYLGLRKAELLALRWEHLDLNEHLAFVKNQEHFTTKSGKERSVPICDELAELLLPFHGHRGLVLKPKKEFVPGKRYRWDLRFVLKASCSAAGLDPAVVTPHVLRHTFASIAAQKGVSLYKIASWMGHSMVEVTEMYAHLAAYDPDINRLNPVAAGPMRPRLRIVK